MADQDGHHSEMMTKLLCHVTSSPKDADFKGDIFIFTAYPPRLIDIAFIFNSIQYKVYLPQLHNHNAELDI